MEFLVALLAGVFAIEMYVWEKTICRFIVKLSAQILPEQIRERHLAEWLQSLDEYPTSLWRITNALSFPIAGFQIAYSHKKDEWRELWQLENDLLYLKLLDPLLDESNKLVDSMNTTLDAHEAISPRTLIYFTKNCGAIAWTASQLKTPSSKETTEFLIRRALSDVDLVDEIAAKQFQEAQKKKISSATNAVRAFSRDWRQKNLLMRLVPVVRGAGIDLEGHRELHGRSG